MTDFKKVPMDLMTPEQIREAAREAARPYFKGQDAAATDEALNGFLDLPTLSLAGLAEGQAVYDPVNEVCAACGLSKGAPGTFMGVEFTLCETTPEGRACGSYRSAEPLTYRSLTDAALRAMRAARGLPFDRPTIPPVAIEDMRFSRPGPLLLGDHRQAAVESDRWDTPGWYNDAPATGPFMTEHHCDTCETPLTCARMERCKEGKK